MKGETQKLGEQKTESASRPGDQDQGPQTTGPAEARTRKATRPARARPRGDGNDEMLTKEELAAKLKVTLRTIENWQRAGHLPFIKIASVVLFHWPDVIAHLKTKFQVSRSDAGRFGQGNSES